MNRLNSNEAFKLISHILQKDSKSSTYKLALLRGTIEVLAESEALIYEEDDICYIPLAHLCEKWVYYYTPFVFNNISQNSGNNISFYNALKTYIECYKGTLQDILKGISKDIRSGFKNKDRKIKYLTCIKEIADCIIKNPMKHIAFSYYKKEYQLYHKRSNPNIKHLITDDLPLYKNTLHNSLGYIGFKKFIQPGLILFGSFIIGEKSLLQNWAHLTLGFKNNQSLPIKVEEIVQLLHHSTEIRSVEPPKKFYQKLQEEGKLYCIWSGKKLKTEFDTDHVIPHSYWKNNDIWNLLPSSKNINSNIKKDKIPSVERLQQQKDLIINTWSLTHNEYKDQFEREIALTLNITSSKFSLTSIFNSLCEKSDYLIDELGLEEW